MKVSKQIVLLLVLAISPFAFSQESEIPAELELTAKDSIVTSSWIFGVGWNAVDDAGDEFSEPFNITDNWNVVPYPSRLSIGKYFKNGLGLELIGAYNQYLEGKLIDGVIIAEDIDYFSADFRISYDLNKILGETGWFDPYVGIGAGYTDANNQGRGTYNTAVGFRTWFSDKLGLDLNGTAKWTMNQENSTNHLQYAAGVVYRFGITKELSEKGEEKLKKLQELQEEQQRVQDSINAANRAEEEARRLAEQLEEERRLAEAKKAAEEAERAKKRQIENSVKDLGDIYFNLNSSYLTAEAKSKLDKLAEIVAQHPTLIIDVKSHTDSRGASTYNQWLSERRVKRTVEYLLSKNIDQNRISAEALGEAQLTNECADNVYCPEEKHRENRRSEFTIKWVE